ncbi:hypothetical protein DAPPUDRAFT_338498, partial [Daphnia pulex]
SKTKMLMWWTEIRSRKKIQPLLIQLQLFQQLSKPSVIQSTEKSSRIAWALMG